MGMLDNVKNAGSGDKGEMISDTAIEKGGDFADSKTGGKHADKLDRVEEQADKRIGDSGTTATDTKNA